MGSGGLLRVGGRGLEVANGIIDIGTLPRGRSTSFSIMMLIVFSLLVFLFL